MPTGFRRRGISALTAVLAGVALAAGTGSSAHAGAAERPNLVKGSAYLVAPARLIGGHYYNSFGRTADFGLTIDGALALAATGDQDQALKEIVSFLAHGGQDASGKTINYWTGIGTRNASGGSIGKEALLAEVVGANPRDFGGRDLIAALDASICPRAGAGGSARCPAAGSYSFASSVFDQSLGILGQLRAGQRRQAAAAVRCLERLQLANGSFPSLIPGTGGDVDSTAMAVMALALVPGRGAAADVRAGLAWIAGRQNPDGGFPGAGGNSVNSAGLAIQALALRQSAYQTRIAAADAFLAREQNADGGFSLGPGSQPGSDLRASTQAVSGAAGIPFGTLRRALSHPATASSGPGGWTTAFIVIVVLAVAAAVAAATMRRRRRRSPAASAPEIRADPVGRHRR